MTLSRRLGSAVVVTSGLLLLDVAPSISIMIITYFCRLWRFSYSWQVYWSNGTVRMVPKWSFLRMVGSNVVIFTISDARLEMDVFGQYFAVSFVLFWMWFNQQSRNVKSKRNRAIGAMVVDLGTWRWPSWRQQKNTHPYYQTPSR